MFKLVRDFIAQKSNEKAKQQNPNIYFIHKLKMFAYLNLANALTNPHLAHLKTAIKQRDYAKSATKPYFKKTQTATERNLCLRFLANSQSIQLKKAH